MLTKDNLSIYRKKRDFEKTLEPSGMVSKKTGRSYLIQKHAASHLHYDFRLELNGVLKSWAIPKGPSYDPADKRLAMQVEDHPVDYGSFEGTIPKGQYGGGTVMLWDTGTWEPVGVPEEGLRKGKLVFQLHGKRLKGEWTLVRTFSRDGSHNKWLLIKHKDEYVKMGYNAEFLEKSASSVVSKRKMDEIARAANNIWHSDRAQAKEKNSIKSPKTIPQAKARSGGKNKAGKLPAFSAPQLAMLADDMPKTDDWVHEIKFDGYRIIAHVANGDATLYSRNGNDWTEKFGSISEFLKQYGGNAIIDGEVVVGDLKGGSNFSALKNALSAGDTSQLQYYVFDLLYLNGEDTRKLGLLERKELLQAYIEDNKTAKNSDRIIYSEHFTDNTDHFLQNACSLHLEGVMSKRKDAPYIAGRTKTWLKTKCHKRQEFVIGGFTLSSKGGLGIGSLLLGYYDKGQLIYAGRVGTGFTSEQSRALRKALEKLKHKEMAYKAVPTEGRHGAIWVEPKLVGEVEFTEWTPDGHLRHPSFEGLREDKKPRSIIKEVPESIEKAVHEAETEVDQSSAVIRKAKRFQSTQAKASASACTKKPKPKARSDEKAEVGGITVSHPSRLIFPGTKITKLQLVEYYHSVANFIMPYIEDRPLSVLRCPEGMGKECFFQRHVGFGTNPDIHEVNVGVKGEKRQYMTIDNERGLLSLIQWGVIELHPWQCTDKKLDNPDQMIFDLDPGPAVSWKELIAGAKLVRARLQQIGLNPFLKTTGGKGLHLVVPLSPIYDWHTIKSFTHAIAETIANEKPDQFITTMSKAARKGKIFIDYLRNDVTSTAVAPFSVRARENATVSIPLFWEELKESLVPARFTIETIHTRLNKLKTDPWKNFGRDRQKISKKLLSSFS